MNTRSFTIAHSYLTGKTVSIFFTSLLLLALFLHTTMVILIDTKKPQSPMPYLEAQEQKLWKNLNSYGLDKDMCNTLKKQYVQKRSPKAYKSPKISQETHTIINGVLSDFNINPQTVIVLDFDDSSPAAANDNTLLINESLLKRYPADAQLFIIAHELQHMLYEDIAMQEAMEKSLEEIEKTFKDRPLNPTSSSYPLNQYSRFREERADICAAMKDKKYAHGYVSFMKKHMTFPEYQDTDLSIAMYPKNDDRLKLANAITKHYNNTSHQIQIC